MGKTLEYIETEINEAIEMIAHFRRVESFVNARRYETVRDKTNFPKEFIDRFKIKHGL